MEKDAEMRQGIEQRFANMEASKDKQIVQVEQYAQKMEEALQEVNTRASEAEMRVRELETYRVAWEEQQQVNRTHKRLWTPDRSEAPASQVAGNSSMEPIEESMEPEVSVSDNSDSDKRLNHYDMDVNEVNRMFDCEKYCTGSSL